MSPVAKFAICGLLALVCAKGPSAADERARDRSQLPAMEVDQSEALDRLKRNEIKPLSDVLAAAQAAVPGDVVRVRLKRLRDRAAYEIKIISKQGTVRELYIDPTNLEILRIE